MALSIGATVTTNSTSGTAGSLTVTGHSIDANTNRLIVAVALYFDVSSGVPVTGVTFDGNAMTKVSGSGVTQAAAAHVEHWYYDSPSGSGNVVVSMTGSGARIAATAYNVIDAGTMSGLTTQAAASGNPSLTVTSATGSLVVDALAMADDSSATTLTIGASQTQIALFDTNAGSRQMAASYEAGAASVSMDWSQSAADQYAYEGFSIAPAGASGPSDPTTVAASNETLTTIDLSWVDPNDPDVPIRAYYKAAASSTWLLAATLPAGTTSYTFTELTADTSYHVGVAAWDSPDESAIVYVTQATLDPVTELTGVTAGSPSHVSIPLTWTDPNSPNYPVKVYYRTPAGSGEWTLKTTTAAGAGGVTVGGLSAETQYDVGGAAFNDPYESAVVYDTTTTTAAPAAGDLNGQPRCSITITFGF